MKQTAYARRHRVHWFSVVAAMMLLGVLGLSSYTSYVFYHLVRDTVGRSINQPSFEVLSRQAGLSLPPAVAGPLAQANPPPASEAASGPAPLVLPTEAAPAVQADSSPSQEAQPSVQLPAQERINILILGIDRRQGERGPCRTDTMIVVTVDPQQGTAGLFSIPRDLWVPIPGYGENRINTANFLGDLKNYPGGGPALAKKTVSYNFGIPVHYYVRINFEGFKRIVDTIGGVDIYVEKEIRDDQYPDEHYGYDPLYIPAGLIHMDGELALKYARTRKADSDFHRAHRQQQVILAIIDKIFSLNLLPSLLPKLPELVRGLSDAVETDMPLDQLIALARLGYSMDFSQIKTVVIDETMTVEHTTPTGASVLLPIRDKIRPVVDDLFWSPLPASSASP